MPDQPTTSENESPKAEKKPWPMVYVVAAVGLFILLFNLYLLLTS
ncbi:hypothetical protein [Cerasicoccus frondis]|nr:hypothetical protein [Cerasicoccus frondis]